jgi:hypothetical protein
MAEGKKSGQQQETGQAQELRAQLETVYAEVSRDMPNSADKSAALAHIAQDISQAEQKIERDRSEGTGFGYGY